ncbi:MAG: type II toxin-antitoxin system RelE/ParE family toxin [Nitrospirota bacterium]|nr:type II toxin-antitoxin system RelE/ParE family toxin [Nitrospirota bacterium]
MMSTLFLAPSAERQLKTLAKPLQKLIVKRLHALRNTPRPHGVKMLDGEEQLYRIGDADYRIVYAIRDKDLLVLVLKSGAHKAVSRP